MTMRNNRRRNSFWRSEGGSTAVEFALVLPLLAMLILGTLGLMTAMSMNTALHFAVEDAARCAAVRTTVCTNQTTTSTYANGKYNGPSLDSLTFTLTSPACGKQVVGAGTFVLSTGLGAINVPMSVQACYPTA
jgi:Flp pilus assembly protein TadG